MSAAASVTMKDFDREVIESNVPVLIDFWAAWCGPCSAIAPAVDAVAAQYAGKAKVLKVNVDEEPELAGRYGVQSIPTLSIFKGGRVVDQIVGMAPQATIAAKLGALVE